MRVNEIFYSLQGEGRYTGTPAVFVRFSGCNLKCWFCDTQHDSFSEMTEKEIVEHLRSFPTKHVILTGGEPTMQVNATLTNLLHEEGYFIHMETNGTLPLKENVSIDWITCSPKGNHKIQLSRIDEVKVVLESAEQDISKYEHINAREYRLQPCDVKNETKNKEILKATIQYVLDHPKWSLSLQSHKLLNIR